VDGFAQVYFLNKKKVSIGDAVATTAIRTLLPIIFFFITTPFILLMNQTLLKLFPGNNSFIYVGVLVLIYLLLAFLAYKILKNSRVVKYRVYKFFTFLKKKKILSHKRVRKMCLPFFREVKTFIAGIRGFLKGSKKNIILSIVFTLLFLLSLFLIPVILIKALGYNISFFSVIGIQIVITFITYFAITPGASGIAESGFALIFSHIISSTDILSLTLTWRFFSIYIGVIIGMILFYLEIFRPSKKVKVLKGKEV
jgi:uncharacterized protein (TIRG00374 family)